VWIGGGVTAPRDVRRTLLLGQPHLGELMPRLRAIAKLMNVSALLTVVTGLGMIFAVGGFARVPHRIHLGLLLTLLAVAAGRWLIRPALGELAAVHKRTVTAEEADRIVAKFWLVNGVEHALRLAVLVLMVYPFSF
jgi:hypothetical protein